MTQTIQETEQVKRRDVLAIDVETTGVDVVNDRIFSFGYCWLGPREDMDQVGELTFNPEVEIPPKIIEMCKVDLSTIARSPLFRDAAEEVYGVLTKAKVLTGFRVMFDIQILWEELYRAGLPWNLNVPIVDSGIIYVKKEPRDLSAAVKHYLKKEHDGAHGARADAVAAAHILVAQRKMYSDLPKEMDKLGKFSSYNPDAVDFAGKLMRDGQGRICYAFGKHKGVPVSAEPSYVEWMQNNNFPTQTLMICAKEIGEGRPRDEAYQADPPDDDDQLPGL